MFQLLPCKNDISTGKSKSKAVCKDTNALNEETNALNEETNTNTILTTSYELIVDVF